MKPNIEVLMVAGYYRATLPRWMLPRIAAAARAVNQDPARWVQTVVLAALEAHEASQAPEQVGAGIAPEPEQAAPARTRRPKVF